MKKIAVFLIVFAATLWGSIGLFIRYFNSLGLDSMQIVMIRMTLSAIIFSIFMLIYNKKAFKIKLKDLWCFLGSGILSLGLFSFCYFKAIELSSMSVASILLYTSPMFVMLFSVVLFKEKLNTMKVVSLVLAFSGCALVTGILTGGSQISVIGLLFGLASGLFYALYSIFSRFALMKGYEPLTITMYTFIFASIAVIAFSNPIPVVKVMFSSAKTVFISILFAVLNGVLSYFAYTFALKYIKSSTASIISTIEPVVATIAGAVVFSEAVEFPTGYLGILLVLASVVIINIKIKPQKRRVIGEVLTAQRRVAEPFSGVSSKQTFAARQKQDVA